MIFTYSLGSGSDLVLPHEIACNTGGLWSKIPDGEDLSGYMSSYYKLFALGLGDEENKDFVAWVEPYEFATGGEKGTTVSAPVYDRAVNPPMFIGVAAMDFTVAFMTEIAGGTDSYASVLSTLVKKSMATCPKLNLNQCETQALRKLSGGDDAMCPDQCTDTIGIEPKACLGKSDYP